MAYILGLFVITRIALTSRRPSSRTSSCGSSPSAAWKLHENMDRLGRVVVHRHRQRRVLCAAGQQCRHGELRLFPPVPGAREAGLARRSATTRSSGIIVSNVCLLVACYYIYRYVGLDSRPGDGKAIGEIPHPLPRRVRLLGGADGIAVRGPCPIACLYYARKGNWLVAGVLGFFVPLARLPGLAIVVPLSYEYVRQNAPSLAALKDHVLQRLAKPEVLALLMPLLGLGLFVGLQLLPDRRLPRVPPHTVDLGRPHGPAARRAADPSRPGQRRHTFTGAIFTVAALALMLLFIRKGRLRRLDARHHPDTASRCSPPSPATACCATSRWSFRCSS